MWAWGQRAGLQSSGIWSRPISVQSVALKLVSHGQVSEWRINDRPLWTSLLCVTLNQTACYVTSEVAGLLSKGLTHRCLTFHRSRGKASAIYYRKTVHCTLQTIVHMHNCCFHVQVRYSEHMAISVNNYAWWNTQIMGWKFTVSELQRKLFVTDSVVPVQTANK
jgi:hypothetical protein